MNPNCKGRTITIHGRRWFQRSYGNTYHTVTVAVNGREVFRSSRQYGYGDQYVTTAMSYLETAGIVKRQVGEAIWQYAERTGTRFVQDAVDVSRERDL